MNGRAFALAAAMSCLPVVAQTPKTAPNWPHPKTSWGDPDLQGVWTGTEMIGTPLQRAEAAKGTAEVGDEEFARREARQKAERDFDSAEFAGPQTRCDPKRGGLGNTPDTCKASARRNEP